MDQLDITGLRIKTRIGIHAWEQRILQDVLLDLSISFDSSACGDSIDNTIDYDALCQCVIKHVSQHTFQLIETLAEQVAILVKQQFPRIESLSVRVSKPHAVPAAANISVTLKR